MRILQLSPQFPFPYTDGGKIGIANIYKNLSKSGCEMVFFAFNDDEIMIEDFKEAEKYGEIIINKNSTKNTIKRIFYSVFDNYPIYLRKHINPVICDHIDKIIETHKFDFIHCDHSAMAPLGLYIKNKFKIPIGLRLHNIEYKIWERYADSLSKFSAKRLYIKRQAKLLKNQESKIYSQFDICYTVTDHDKKEALLISPKANVVTVNVGVDTEEHIRNNVAKNRYELIYATNYNWIHNVTALDWFVEKVLPIVKKEFPETVLTLLGKNIPEHFLNKEEYGIYSKGFVPKIQPYFSNALIYIAPLFVGSGVRVKILEAMSLGLPVVASPISAEGIKAKEEDGLFVAKDEFEFFNKIKFLMDNYEKAIELGEKAREFIVRENNWEQKVAIISENYKIISRKANK